MATDKKISELPVASGISSADISVIVKDGIDYSYSFTQLTNFVANNITTGAQVDFGTTVPLSTSGKNGDIYFNTINATIYKKVSGTWVTAYILPANITSSNSILYDQGEPASSVGSNGDTFIDTDTGVFYNKSAGSWHQVFSIDSGPMGPSGNSILNGISNPTNALGANGDFYLNTGTLTLFGPKASGMWPAGVSIKGSNAHTILNGSGSPSNTIGENGDFYLDKDTYNIYGPKATGNWPPGVSLIYSAQDPAIIEIPEGSPLDFEINYASNYTQFGNDPTLTVDLIIDANKRRIAHDVIIEKRYVAGILSTIHIYGHNSGDDITTIDNLLLTIKN